MKYLLVELYDNTLEMAEISDEELAEIKPVIKHIIQYPVSHDESDYGSYGHLDGFETFAQYIPDDGMRTVSDIRVVKVEEILL